MSSQLIVPPSISVPDVGPMKHEAEGYVQSALVVVKDVDSHARGLVVLRECRRRIRAVEEACEPTRKSLDAAKKDFLALRDGITNVYYGLASSQEILIKSYELKAAREAESERRRLEILQRAAEEERRLAGGIHAAKSGGDKLADAILDETPRLPVVHVASEVAKVEGVSKPPTSHPA